MGHELSAVPLRVPATKPGWIYQLHVDIPATDAAVLHDGLEGEPFGLRARLGVGELERQIEDLAICVETATEKRWEHFETDVATLSVYLSQYVVGRELHLQWTSRGLTLEGWKIVALRGEAFRLLLDLRRHAGTETIEEAGEDERDLSRRWTALPEWLRAAMRFSHPTLRDL